MATTQVVRTGERNDISIVEPELLSALVNLWSLREYIPHAVEDSPQVVRAF